MMARGRPGGNPGLAEYSFKVSKQNQSGESMQTISLRVEKGIAERLKLRPGWQDAVRSLLSEYLDNAPN